LHFQPEESKNGESRQKRGILDEFFDDDDDDDDSEEEEDDDENEQDDRPNIGHRLLTPEAFSKFSETLGFIVYSGNIKT
jgi:hypothetical protein